ncbi:hypothetical protein IPV09_03655 [Tessaracoccus sp. SD287]|uniref:mannosyltransferase family protein n=1 Tax=Tessaracoccus sp. SD287 TaxID=2782008 RepID=UPI001A96EDD4|nr:mannosyltransferase family protein [Tessaracoccus sp. SD287]MBO1030425.1 hypothetical protein [Tessaracoccus sp. SD287]
MPVPARPRVGLRQVWWVLALFFLQKLLFLALLVATTERGYLADMFQWDGPRYLEIAVEGYHYPAYDAAGHEINSNLAFFPLYPLAGRLLALAPGLDVAHALLAVSLLGSLAAAWGLFALGVRLANRAVGVALALGWGLLPRSFLQVMPYSEGLFTALTAWSCYALVQRRYWLAGLLCALAGFTRPTGAATLAAVGGYLLVLLALSLLPATRHRVGTARVTIIGAGLLSTSGLALAFAHVAWRTGSLAGYGDIQERWNLRMGPVTTTWRLWRAALTTEQPTGYETTTAVAWTLPVWTMLLVALLLIAWRRPGWWPVAVHAAVTWLMMAATQTYFHSRERYLLPAFGLVLPVALAVSWAWARGRGRWLLRPLLISCCAVASVASAWWGVELVTTSKISP